MSTEPEPLTLAEAVHRAVRAVDPSGESPSAADVIARFEDSDEPIAGLADVDGRMAEEFGALDPQEEDPVVQMIRAVTVYLAFKRTEAANGDDGELLRLAARAEYSGNAPEPVASWLATRGIDA
jgi:hypothetical protein